jgi:hypothetical protein
MQITSHKGVQIKDNEGYPVANIIDCSNGFIADIDLLYENSVYVGRRVGARWGRLHIFIAPSGENWKHAIEKEGYEVIGRLSEIVAHAESVKE